MMINKYILVFIYIFYSMDTLSATTSFMLSSYDNHQTQKERKILEK